ncbi:MAG TPA: SRPBCC family protein [Thermoleophilaceae bacterium]|nr:SRPBCC family protein [Thermoleophilaceae bacterium]
MREVIVETWISAPREGIFDYIADLAGRPAYCDHYLEDYRLARVNSYGVGAAARFRLRAPLAREYAELAIVECARPRRIVEEVRVGRLGRNRSVAVYELSAESDDLTHVELTTYSEPATPIDVVKQLGAARWIRRQTKIALERLRLIFEEPPAEPLARATVAGYEPLKAPRFGAHVGTDPARPSGLAPGPQGSPGRPAPAEGGSAEPASHAG